MHEEIPQTKKFLMTLTPEESHFYFFIISPLKSLNLGKNIFSLRLSIPFWPGLVACVSILYSKNNSG
jgi:hypothetical protein